MRAGVKTVERRVEMADGGRERAGCDGRRHAGVGDWGGGAAWHARGRLVEQEDGRVGQHHARVGCRVVLDVVNQAEVRERRPVRRREGGVVLGFYQEDFCG